MLINFLGGDLAKGAPENMLPITDMQCEAIIRKSQKLLRRERAETKRGRRNSFST